GHVESERLGRTDRAIEAWRSAQTIDAGDPRVLDALQALFIQQGQWTECADLMEKRVALAEDPAARIAQLLELAAIAHERLGAAGDAWEESIAEGRALAEELEAAHPAVAARVWRLVGAWTRDQAGNRDDAAHALERAFRLAPDRDTLTDLIAILRADSRWGE